MSMDMGSVDSGAALNGEDLPGTHNMMVVGVKAIFLSHLPMFVNGGEAEITDFTSLHRFQVVLEATFSRAGEDLSGIYAADRAAHSEVKMYTLNPEKFVLSRLFTPDTKPVLSEFTATVWRGHLERGEIPFDRSPIDGLKHALVTVKRVVHAHKFDFNGIKPQKLTYFLFGKAGELFLAHLITKPPDFDQILSIEAIGHEFTDDELVREVRVTVDQGNLASERIRENQLVTAQFFLAGANQPLDLKLRAVKEFYFEEGELLVPPTFDQTPEEQKSGF